VTLTAEMLRISRSFGSSRSKRLGEINDIKQLVARQIKEGRETARLMSSELNNTIKIDLKNILKHVAASQKETWSLIDSYKKGRHSDTVELQARLELDRTRLTATVKKMLFGFEQDRTSARAIIRKSAANRKIDQQKILVSAIVTQVDVPETMPEVELIAPAIKTSIPTNAASEVEESKSASEAAVIKVNNAVSEASAAKDKNTTSAAAEAKGGNLTSAAHGSKGNKPASAPSEFFKSNPK
jgi:hypothetical protein